MERLRRAFDALGFRVSDYGRRRIVFILLLFAAGTILPAGPAYAASLSTSFVSVTDTQPGATANYDFTGSGFTSSPTKIYCVQETFTNNSDGTGGTPGGTFSTSGTSLDASTNLITAANFTLAGGSPNGTIAYSYSTGQTPVTTSAAKFNVDGLTNASAGIYWMTFATYSAAASGGVCGGSVIDSTVVGFNITAGAQMTMNVNPTLTTTVTGVSSSTTCDGTSTTVGTSATAITFGVVSSSSNSMACQEVAAATNASNGYSLYVRETGPLANSGGHNLTAVSGSNASPSAFPSAGTEAYGYTTSSSTLSTCGGSCNANRFTDGSTYDDYAPYTSTNAEVGYASGPNSTNYFIGTQVGINISTAAGNYQTTVVYTCTPIF